MTLRTFGITVPAEARWLKLIRGFVKPILLELALKDADRVLLAIDESCANVIKHRCESLAEGGLSLQIELDDSLLRIRLMRFCRESEISAIKPRALDEVRPGGLGTHFVQQAMDEVRFEPESDEPLVRSLVLEKRLPKRGAPSDEQRS